MTRMSRPRSIDAAEFHAFAPRHARCWSKLFLSTFATLVGVVACSPAPSPNDAGSDASGDSNVAPDSGGSGTATITGTLDGKTIDAQGAVALKGVYDSSYPGIVTIMIGNMPDMCPIAQEIVAGSNKANLFLLGFTLGQTTATSTVGVGTYGGSDTTNELDAAGWDSYDATCTQTQDPGYTTALVTLTSVDPYIGTFDVSFSNGDHVTGSFNAPLCDTSSDGGEGDGGAQCVP